ncbi:MAG: glycosyltransferase family 4 protein [Flavobacteriales bacterium]|nr:glycosyltransferase family 4 protein [Flavobacteriales bacterium]MCB9447416.1 glycosyltransferase family 4 protein [Flavobacteriales bacterium]
MNNLFIVPLAKLLGKKIIWWDSGSSQMVRTPRRKVIDFVMGILIMLTDAQIAYSQKGRRYMSEYMHAGNCHCLLNAINTSYFEGIREEVNHVADTRETNSQQIRLLYVGVVEKRKMVRELIDMVSALNRAGTRTYMLDIVGGGSEYEPLIKYVEENSIRHVKLLGPKYAYEELKPHYFAADIFVLPGDGGLAVLQSVLFGLPVLTVHADGTEEDYLPPECIFSSLGEIQEALLRMEPVKRLRSSDAARFYHINWITGFVELSNQC